MQDARETKRGGEEEEEEEARRRKGCKRERRGGEEREREREHAELAERVPGDAYHSYLDKCIKTTLHSPLSSAISNWLCDSLRSQNTPRFLAARLL